MPVIIMVFGKIGRITGLLAGFVLIFSLGSCIPVVKGEFYLTSKNYADGIQAFEKAIEEKPGNPDNHYYLGRFLLAQNKYEKAVKQLHRAVALNPSSADYYFWLGVCYAGLNDRTREKKNYQKTIELKPRHYQAHTYLGHNLFRSGKYRLALNSYENALAVRSRNSSALYNKALISKKLRRTSEAKSAFIQYIDMFYYSPKALAAAVHLNQMGNFKYRVHLMGYRRIMAGKIIFEGKKEELTTPSLKSLKKIGTIIKKNKELTLYILVYQKNNRELARKKALKIKTYLQNYFLTIDHHRVKASWFDTPEIVNLSGQHWQLDESVNFFATPEQKK